MIKILNNSRLKTFAISVLNNGNGRVKTFAISVLNNGRVKTFAILVGISVAIAV